MQRRIFELCELCIPARIHPRFILDVIVSLTCLVRHSAELHNVALPGDSVLLGCDIASVGKRIPTFSRERGVVCDA